MKRAGEPDPIFTGKKTNNMKKRKIFSSKYVNYSLILIIGLFLGWLIFHPKHSDKIKNGSTVEVSRETIWTCAMHPQIRMSQPGQCPLCGMDLMPLEQEETSSVDPDAIRMTPEAAQLANVLTSVVTKQKAVKEVRLYGKVQADERLLQSQVAHIPGRIESLNVNFTGETVVIGQILGQIYSPELITAQQELLEAAKTKVDQPAIYEAAKGKLQQWKLTDDQISEIEESGKVQNTVNIVSNTSGVITSRKINKGDYVSKGTVLFEITDLSKVWIMFDAYESDLPFIRNGDKISFTLQALPGNQYSGRIIFIDPVIDPVTRVAHVRAETKNSAGKLKPGMFTDVELKINLGRKLAVPDEAVIDTGLRQIVYVDKGDGYFEPRAITTGLRAEKYGEVVSGLKTGEKVAIPDDQIKELTVKIQDTYQQAINDAKIKVEQTVLKIPGDRIHHYQILWKRQTFSADVIFNMDNCHIFDPSENPENPVAIR